MFHVWVPDLESLHRNNKNQPSWWKQLRLRGPKQWRHFTCSSRVLTNGILHIWKNCQNRDILRIRIRLAISSLSTCTGHERCCNFLRRDAHAQIRIVLDEKCSDTACFLRISGAWHFFLICKIPLGKCSYKPWKVQQLFPPRRPHTDLHISEPKMGRKFAVFLR